MNFSSLIGAFSTLDLPQLDGNRFWDTSNLYLNGTLSLVPEPAISVLLFTALGAMLYWKIMRRRSYLASRDNEAYNPPL